MTKKKQIKEHLEKIKTITSLEAFKLYGVTRLSDIIFRFRNSGMNIKTHQITKRDRNDNWCTFAKYELISRQ